LGTRQQQQQLPLLQPLPLPLRHQLLLLLCQPPQWLRLRLPLPLWVPLPPPLPLANCRTKLPINSRGELLLKLGDLLPQPPLLLQHFPMPATTLPPRTLLPPPRPARCGTCLGVRQPLLLLLLPQLHLGQPLSLPLPRLPLSLPLAN